MSALSHQFPAQEVRCAACACQQRCWVGRLTPDERDRVDLLIRRRAFHRGEVLQHEGAVSVSLRALRQGLVLRTRLGKDGQERPVALDALGGGMGFLGFFRLPSQTSAVTLGSGLLCEVPLEVLRRYERELPSLSGALIHEAVSILSSLATWSEAMRLRGVNAQLAYALLLMADSQGKLEVELPTQAVLGALLGASRETVARSLLSFEQAQVFERLDRKRVRLDGVKLRERLQVLELPSVIWTQLSQWMPDADKD